MMKLRAFERFLALILAFIGFGVATAGAMVLSLGEYHAGVILGIAVGLGTVVVAAVVWGDTDRYIVVELRRHK